MILILVQLILVSPNPVVRLLQLSVMTVASVPMIIAQRVFVSLTESNVMILIHAPTTVVMSQPEVVSIPLRTAMITTCVHLILV
jgi:hypothetical protein